MANDIVPTRQDIISNMYALRAGLSVVSEEVQIATNARNKADEAKRTSETTVKEDLDSWEQEVRRIQGDLDREHADLEKNKNLENAPYKNVAKLRGLSLLFAFLALLMIGFMVYVICAWIYCDNEFANSPNQQVAAVWFRGWNKLLGFQFWILLVLTPLTLAIIVFLFILLFKMLGKLSYAVKANKKTKEIRENAHTMASVTIPNNIAKLELELADVKAKKEIEEQKCAKILENANNQHQNELAIIYDKHVSPAKTLYQALLQIFSQQIDERDWASLDYLIYAVETGRAESIKESLQLLDREKQTDRIVAAIQRASREIAQILNRGFSALSQQMTQSFVVLSQQIQVSSEAIMQKIGQAQRQQEAQTSLLSMRIAELTDQQALNRALMEKANTSSNQLVSDVHKIAELETMRYNRGY